jgi:hypothetical protein
VEVNQADGALKYIPAKALRHARLRTKTDNPSDQNKLVSRGTMKRCPCSSDLLYQTELPKKCQVAFNQCLGFRRGGKFGPGSLSGIAELLFIFL